VADKCENRPLKGLEDATAVAAAFALLMIKLLKLSTTNIQGAFVK
jgi:hypothetical protein